jgi:hypothetical protein
MHSAPPVLHAASWVFTSVKVMHVGIQVTTVFASVTLFATVVVGASTSFLPAFQTTVSGGEECVASTVCPPKVRMKAKAAT